MPRTLNAFLDEVAERGSWIGGGSVAALTAAVAAALLEKLVQQPRIAQRLRGLREECVRLIEEDATSFARVIRASRAGRRRAFQQALKQATEVPCRVLEVAQAIHTTSRAIGVPVPPQFQSDLRCVNALSRAASESAAALIRTNLAWLRDPPYRTIMRRRIRIITTRHAASAR